MKDKNAWALDLYLAKQIAEGTKKLLLWDHGHPARCTHEEWREILTKINRAFWKYYNHEEEMNSIEFEGFLNSREWVEAWSFFQIYFTDLWD